MADIKNEFSWSKSRHERFSGCRREYFFAYYASWGGWQRTAPPLARETYLLKKLSNRFQWAGSMVHDAIRDVLTRVRHGRPTPTVEQAVEVLHRTMQDDFRASRRKTFREGHGKPKRPALLEHEYDEPLAPEVWKANWENAKTSLERFFSSRWLERARSLRPDQWLSIDDLASFELQGVKVFAAPDFAYREDDGSVVVVDWKTGRPHEGEAEQVQGYVLFAARTWGADPARTVAKLVYLGSGDEVDVRCDQAAMEEYERHFAQSVAGMEALLEGPRALNRPRDAEAFGLTDDRNRCRGCCFRRICGRL